MSLTLIPPPYYIYRYGEDVVLTSMKVISQSWPYFPSMELLSELPEERKVPEIWFILRRPPPRHRFEFAHFIGRTSEAKICPTAVAIFFSNSEHTLKLWQRLAEYGYNVGLVTVILCIQYSEWTLTR